MLLLAGETEIGGTERMKTAKFAPKAILIAAGAKAAMSVCFLLMFAGLPALAAEVPEKGPSELLFIAQITVLMLVGRLLGEAMLRMKQPAVMGQLIAGLILGPSLFGLLFPDIQHALFPDSPEQRAMLSAISQFGILVLLLLTGMETDLPLVRQAGRAAVFSSITGIIVPFTLGFAFGEYLPDSLLPDPSKRLVTSLFIGTALSIASVQIVGTVVREMNFTRRTVGQVIVASAIIADSIGWIIVSVIFSLALRGNIEPLPLAESLLGTLAFLAASLTIGRRAVFFIIRWANDHLVSDFAVITVILLIMCVMAMISSAIGVHAVLGAFVAGVLIGESPILTRHIDEQLRGLITAFFAPVFFGLAGLSADLTILGNGRLAAVTAIIVLIASLGKFGGGFIGGKLGGLSFREDLALASGMNARGSTEVIIASVGLSIGALSHDLFTMIVAMAVITTMGMPPMLRWALGRLPMRKDEKLRIEREEMEERGFVPKLERLLLAVDESANGRFASRVAGLLAGSNALPTTVMHIKTDKKTGKAAAVAEKEKAELAGKTVKVFAGHADRAQADDEKTDAKLAVTTIVEKSAKPEAVAAEAEKGYDLMIVGLETTVARRNEFHEDVTNLTAGFEGPVAVADARDKLLERPLHGTLDMLVPVNGTEMSRRAAEVAIAMARASKATLTALYVATAGKKRRSRQYEEAILKDIVKLAESYELELRTAVRSDEAAEEAILKELARGKHNLIVMGVGRRPGDKLFFGDTAAGLLEKSKQSLLFVGS
jgi:Kef-type K+ transport system membrane component KefB/nucleotide-binding universal stress UspA family protein